MTKREESIAVVAFLGGIRRRAAMSEMVEHPLGENYRLIRRHLKGSSQADRELARRQYRRSREVGFMQALVETGVATLVQSGALEAFSSYASPH